VIAEAIDTAVTLGWALLAWLAVLAAVATIVVLAVAAGGVWAVRAAWRASAGPWGACGRFRARFLAAHRARRPQRRTGPRWARTDHHHYEEAA
jgi:hypothetical protein